MKAVELESPGHLVYREDVRVPLPAVGQLRVKTQAASICGSDMLRVFSGAAKVYPLILGHECSGVVDMVGEDVSHDWMGRHVSIAPLIPCMTCDSCKHGLYASCTNYSFIGSRIAGGFAEYLVLPVGNAVLLPEGMDAEMGALIEPTTVALHALKRAGGAHGLRVAVFGVGSIGMLTVCAARFTGAAHIIGVDVTEHNLAMASALGAHTTINASAGDAAKQIKALTDGGVDIAVEVSGAPQAIAQCMDSLRPGGHLVFVGNQPLDATFSAGLIEHYIMRQQLNLHGAWMSYSAPFPGSEWTDAINILYQHRPTFQKIVSHRVALAELPQMFDKLHNKELVHSKVIVCY